MCNKKIINGKKMIVMWHIDDIKVSHESETVISRMKKWLNKTYEIIFEDGSGKKKISRSKIHEYLSMTLNFY